jgi:two-component system alkaline phosphatase synthesis response regulator PhoP
MKKILVVDDEPDIVDLVSRQLHKEGFRVLAGADADDALRLARLERPDLIILDLMLPGMDGLSVCRILKEDPRTRTIPIIMLTAKAEDNDRIVGLEMGADDYVTKPFNLKEVTARVKSVLRRTEGRPPEPETFKIDTLTVDFPRRSVTIGKKHIDLTAKEFDLLTLLIKSGGRVLSKSDILDRLWDINRTSAVTTRSLDVHIARLRKKLKPIAKRIVTLRNVGYKFSSDEPIR